jgi:hypothetical protein
MMNRRTFIATVAGGFLAAPRAGEAQQAARPPASSVPRVVSDFSYVEHQSRVPDATRVP